MCHFNELALYSETSTRLFGANGQQNFIIFHPLFSALLIVICSAFNLFRGPHSWFRYRGVVQSSNASNELVWKQKYADYLSVTDMKDGIWRPLRLHAAPRALKEKICINITMSLCFNQEYQAIKEILWSRTISQRIAFPQFSDWWWVWQA